MLSECRNIYGSHMLVAEDPPIRDALNISFYPSNGTNTELFHSNGRAVSEAVRYMGLEIPNTPQGVLQRTIKPFEEAPDKLTYIYAGVCMNSTMATSCPAACPVSGIYPPSFPTTCASFTAACGHHRNCSPYPSSATFSVPSGCIPSISCVFLREPTLIASR